jgi:predicted ATPase
MIHEAEVTAPLMIRKDVLMPAGTVKFRPGINVLVGLNGAGKSTLAQSLVWQAYHTNKQVGGKACPWTTENLINEKWAKLVKPTWNIKGKFIRLRYFNSAIHGFANATAFDFDMPIEMQIWGDKLSAGQALLRNIGIAIGSKDNLENAMVILDQPETAMDSDMVEKLAMLIITLAYKYNSQVIVATHNPTIMSLSDQILAFEFGKFPTWTIPEIYLARMEQRKTIADYLFRGPDEQREIWIKRYLVESAKQTESQQAPSTVPTS